MNNELKTPVSGNIPYDTVLKYHQLYLDGKHPSLSRTIGSKPETEKIWFKLDDSMRKFLNEVINDPEVSGIRVYFMTYPDKQEAASDGTLIPQNPNDVSQLTIGLVTTRENAGCQDDYPETKEGFKMLLAPPMNHGELCPQQCV